jgi:hypothetical protein
MRFNKRSSIKKNYSGGGGGTVSTIPEWAQPYLKNVGNATESAYAAGELGKVAGASQLQQKAFGMGSDATVNRAANSIKSLDDTQKRMSTLANTGGANELQDALKLDIGMSTANLNNQFGSTGVLGSTRHALATSAADSAAKAKYAQQVINNKINAEKQMNEASTGQFNVADKTTSSLANLGNQQRGIDQQGLDATWQGLQRYASTIYGNPARQQATSGGK